MRRHGLPRGREEDAAPSFTSIEIGPVVTFSEIDGLLEAQRQDIEIDKERLRRSIPPHLSEAGIRDESIRESLRLDGRTEENRRMSEAFRRIFDALLAEDNLEQ